MLYDKSKAVFANSNVIQIKKTMIFDTLCRRLHFLDKVNLYRENSLYSDTWKNVPSLLVRGFHVQKDMIYGRRRMDDIIERPLDFWLKKVAQGILYIRHY